MKKNILITMAAASLSILTGCNSTQFGHSDTSGFIAFPPANNDYEPGQLVEQYSSDRVEILADPELSGQRLENSSEWGLSLDTVEPLKDDITSRIEEVVDELSEFEVDWVVVADFIDTTSKKAPKLEMWTGLKKELENEALHEMIAVYAESGTRHDVLTQLLGAKITFKVLNEETNEPLHLSEQVVALVNASLMMDFSLDASGNSATTGDMIIGMFYDPKMVMLLVDAKKERAIESGKH